VEEFLTMIQRIYIDTSIVGGYFDKEFEAETRALFERLQKKEVAFVVSDLLRQELLGAPRQVQNLLERYDSTCFEAAILTQEAKDLADHYLAEKVVGKTCLEDCQHIAIATISKVDVLASWNFKHIVNLVRIKGYNAVNMKMGYATLEIRNPKDLMIYESI
jgi:predicted nucleic acid-binding protein